MVKLRITHTYRRKEDVLDERCMILEVDLPYPPIGGMTLKLPTVAACGRFYEVISASSLCYDAIEGRYEHNTTLKLSDAMFNLRVGCLVDAGFVDSPAAGVGCAR